MAQIIKDEYEGDPPEEYKEIIKFPGIGPKMAYLYLTHCCDKVEGIAVDTHVHRICNRLKWVDTKTAEETRKNLQQWMPKDYWDDVNTLLVGLGQMICEAKKPKCDDCRLNKLCDFRLNNLNESKGKLEDGVKTKSKSRSKSKAKLQEGSKRKGEKEMPSKRSKKK
jgi:endonuclease-3